MAKRLKRRWMQGAFPKSTRGAFTKKAKQAGEGTQTYARQVAAHPAKYDTHTIRQANAAITGAAISRRRKLKRRR